MRWRFSEGRRNAQRQVVESVEGSVDRVDWHASLLDTTQSFTDVQERALIHVQTFAARRTLLMRNIMPCMTKHD